MKTEGNFNNDIGLPLTILNLENEHQAAVVEMGMRGKGEISRLVDIAMPTCAVISSVENVHLETMGSLENIAEAKCEILNNLTEEQFALIDGDNEMLVQIASRYPCKVYTFGLNDNCDFRIDEINIDSMGMHLDLDLMGQYKRLYFTLPSRRLASNIAASVGAAFLLGIDIDSIASGLKAYHPSGNRMNITRFTEGGTLINDTYNANPLSMAAVLETGREMAREGRLVAVLGDMYELGDHEIGGHLEVGQKAFELDVDTLIAVGSLAEHIARGAIKAGMPVEKVNHFKDKNDSIKFLKQTFNKRDTIVFKASRGMKLETLVDELLK